MPNLRIVKVSQLGLLQPPGRPGIELWLSLAGGYIGGGWDVIASSRTTDGVEDPSVGPVVGNHSGRVWSWRNGLVS